MKLGIIGAGNVGSTLGTRWAKAGHTVVFGVKDPHSPQNEKLLANAGPNTCAATVQETVSASDIVVLTTPWDAVQEIMTSTEHWIGKIIVDATNPIAPKLAGLELGTTTSAAELIAQWVPQATVVKAFNTVGVNVMANTEFGDQKVAMFYCGDDKEAKEKVRQLAADLGFEPLDAGPLTQARVLEPFAMLWISLAYVAGFGREIAFNFMRR